MKRCNWVCSTIALAGRRKRRRCSKLLLQAQANHPEALHRLGLLAGQAGRLEDAVRLIRQATLANQTSFQIYYNLGIALRRLKQRDEAVVAFERAFQLAPDDPNVANSLGAVLREAGRIDEAITFCQRAVRLKPDFADAYGNLGAALQDAGRNEEAVQAALNAIRLRPDLADAYHNLGLAKRGLGKTDEELAAFQRAISLNPNDPKLYNQLGNAFRSLAKFDDAKLAYERAISIDPNFANAHWDLALRYLLLGDYEQGWAEHEWRLKADEQPLTFTQPRWNGEDITGKTILLHAEQGFGDTIQFARYIPLVAGRGARVMLLCSPMLRRLLQDHPGISQLLAQGEAKPDFDFHCPLMSLPLIFHTTLTNIPPPIPYPRIAVRERTDSRKLKVGLVWAGNPKHPNNHNRSITLSMLEKIADDEVDFFSLQLGEAAKQQSSLSLTQLPASITDFADTAAIIATLDLVISVDTAVAHLAATIGKTRVGFDPVRSRLAMATELR